LYEGEKLISFLSVFASSEEEAELSLFTSAEKSGEGYEGYLIKEAKKDLVALHVLRLLLQIEGNASIALGYASCHGLELDYTEYRMSCAQCVPLSSSLTFQRVIEGNASVFVFLSSEAFGETEESYLGFVSRGWEVLPISCIWP